MPPRPLHGRHGLAIALVVRNEERHIGEWARFHRLAGVRHLFAYDDASTDGTVAELRRHMPAEQLTVIPWGQRLNDRSLGRPIHNQVLAYAHAAANFGGAFRWLACIDADEFLVPVQSRSINEALSHLGPEVVNVSLPWHMFGRCGHHKPPQGGVIENYLHRALDPVDGANFKCIVDPCRLTGIRVHSMETGKTALTWNDKGNAFNLSKRGSQKFYSAEYLQLNHYYSRSCEELEEKIRRGPNLNAKANEYRRKVMRTVLKIEKNQIEDNLALYYLQGFD